MGALPGFLGSAILWTWIAVFVALFLLDFMWAFYTKAITNQHASAAASWAVLVILLSGAAQIGYTTDPWLLIPAALGAFAGTYAAVKIHTVKWKEIIDDICDWR